MEHEEFIFYLNAKEVKFNVCASMKKPKDATVMSIIDVNDACTTEVPIQEKLSVKPLAAVIMNFREDETRGYDDTIHPL